MQMKREMDTCRSQLEQSQKDLAAWKFTPDRYCSLLALSSSVNLSEISTPVDCCLHCDMGTVQNVSKFLIPRRRDKCNTHDDHSKWLAMDLLYYINVFGVRSLVLCIGSACLMQLMLSFGLQKLTTVLIYLVIVFKFSILKIFAYVTIHGFKTPCFKTQTKNQSLKTETKTLKFEENNE